MQHDTWIKIKPECPLIQSIDLFPEQRIPMRDPFPLGLSDNGQTQWIIDIERLSPQQLDSTAGVMAIHNKIDLESAMQKVLKCGGFSITSKWIDMDNLSFGREGLLRLLELVDFLDNNQLSIENFYKFAVMQIDKWVEGEGCLEQTEICFNDRMESSILSLIDANFSQSNVCHFNRK
jgi:hypothetical protein